MRPIAALFIDPRGPYPALAGVDAWGESRDARIYDGPWPVVAHPPCAGWSSLRHLAHGRDTAGAKAAFEAVRRFGGVLEQPAHSGMFAAHGAPAPGQAPDGYGGYTVEVTQVEWGHVARKRTWLYLVGVPLTALEAPPFPGAVPTHWCSGMKPHARTQGPRGLRSGGYQDRQRRATPAHASALRGLPRPIGPLCAGLARMANANDRPTMPPTPSERLGTARFETYIRRHGEMHARLRHVARHTPQMVRKQDTAVTVMGVRMARRVQGNGT